MGSNRDDGHNNPPPSLFLAHYSTHMETPFPKVSMRGCNFNGSKHNHIKNDMDCWGLTSKEVNKHASIMGHEHGFNVACILLMDVGKENKGVAIIY
eukprot:1150316-Pelagomonas_calceolata.AAC.1